MAPKRKKSAPASGGGRRGGGGGIGRKSNKAVRQQTPDSSYVPKKREDTTGRLGKPKRAAASKANEVIQQAADALLTKENGNTYHIDDVPSNSPRAEGMLPFHD
jgi:hypothetical protein